MPFRKKIIIRNYIKRCSTELLEYSGRWHIIIYDAAQGQKKGTNTRLVCCINSPDSKDTYKPIGL